MKKRIVSVILAVCVLGTALAGCGNSTTADNKEGSKDSTEINTQADSAGAQSDSSSDGETASGAVTDVNEDGTVNNPENVKIDDGKLVFWSLFSGGDGTFMDQIISDYNGGSPKMGVQSIMLVWDDYYTKLQTAVAAGKGPDIGISHVSKLPELVHQHGWNVHNTVGGSKPRILIHVYFAYFVRTLGFRCDFFDNRSEHTAGHTPGGPEIHHYRDIRFQNFTFKIFLIKYHCHNYTLLIFYD